MKFNKIFRDNEKAKYDASRLPSSWPSHLHNKCSIPTCYFPNSPQAASGTYNCQGIVGRHNCEGTYYVSPSTAASVMTVYREQMMRDAQAKQWKAQKDAEFERQRVVKSQLDEEARRLAAEELAAKYEERKRNKGASTDSPAYNHAVSSYLARRAAQRRRPTDIIPTDATPDFPFSSSTYGLVHCLGPESPALDGSFNTSLDLTHSPSRMSSRSKSSTKTSSEYNSSRSRQTETHSKWHFGF